MIRIYSAGGGISQSAADARYLLLDASNGPLTNSLTINGSLSLAANNSGVSLQDGSGQTVTIRATGSATPRVLTWDASAFTANRTVILPNVGGDTMTLIAASQTLTNKTLTAPTVNGATISGAVSLSSSSLAPTAGTMTATSTGNWLSSWSRYDLTNAMVVALGAVTTGSVRICTVPAMTAVEAMIFVQDSVPAGTGLTNLGVTAGVGADNSRYISSGDLVAGSIGTVYGCYENVTTLGSSAGYISVPDGTGTTNISLYFTSAGANLADVTNCTGHVWIKTAKLA